MNHPLAATLASCANLRAVKVCTKCGNAKPFSEFTKHKLGRDGLRPTCKTCTAEVNAAYRARTVEQRAAYNKQYRALHREHHLTYNKAWNKRHPERMRAMWLNHRARLAGRREKLAPEQIIARIELYGGKCFYCGKDANTIDHRIPLARGGPQLPANIVPACLNCNSAKANTSPL